MRPLSPTAVFDLIDLMLDLKRMGFKSASDDNDAKTAWCLAYTREDKAAVTVTMTASYALIFSYVNPNTGAFTIRNCGINTDVTIHCVRRYLRQ